MTTEEMLAIEARRSFDYFWLEANTNSQSDGFGLIRDNTKEDAKDMCSVASIGFGLTAIPIGIKNGWITYEQGYERVKGTLGTLLYRADQVEGFFYHFLHMETAKRFRKCEVSIIDTALCLNGCIVVAEYFGGDIKEMFEAIYKRVNWEFYRNEKTNEFYMEYTHERGHLGHWDLYAEQLMQYVLGVASPTHPIPASMYKDMGKPVGRYGEYEFVYTWLGSLFVHQFSHAWFDFRNVRDDEGMDWFENSRLATLANRQYCIDNPDGFKTFHKNSWGLTACSGPSGYSGRYGAPPTGRDGVYEHENDGTVAPCAVAGSLPFAPEECLETLMYFYNEVPELVGQYGLIDSYNLEGEKPWYADHVIGIDKGATLLMIENYKSNFVWDLYMKNKYIQQAIEKLNWKKG